MIEKQKWRTIKYFERQIFELYPQTPKLFDQMISNQIIWLNNMK
jgi:hypothetical protein